MSFNLNATARIWLWLSYMYQVWGVARFVRRQGPASAGKTFCLTGNGQVTGFLALIGFPALIKCGPKKAQFIYHEPIGFQNRAPQQSRIRNSLKKSPRANALNQTCSLCHILGQPTARNCSARWPSSSFFSSFFFFFRAFEPRVEWYRKLWAYICIVYTYIYIYTYTYIYIYIYI